MYKNLRTILKRSILNCNSLGIHISSGHVLMIILHGNNGNDIYHRRV